MRILFVSIFALLAISAGAALATPIADNTSKPEVSENSDVKSVKTSETNQKPEIAEISNAKPIQATVEPIKSEVAGNLALTISAVCNNLDEEIVIDRIISKKNQKVIWFIIPGDKAKKAISSPAIGANLAELITKKNVDIQDRAIYELVKKTLIKIDLDQASIEILKSNPNMNASFLFNEATGKAEFRLPKHIINFYNSSEYKEAKDAFEDAEKKIEDRYKIIRTIDSRGKPLAKPLDDKAFSAAVARDVELNGVINPKTKVVTKQGLLKNRDDAKAKFDELIAKL